MLSDALFDGIEQIRHYHPSDHPCYSDWYGPAQEEIEAVVAYMQALQKYFDADLSRTELREKLKLAPLDA